MIQVVNMETGELCGPNEPGQIYIRGPQIMKGDLFIVSIFSIRLHLIHSAYLDYLKVFVNIV